MTRREWLALAGLACCAFVMNSSEFMPIGLLLDIAADFRMTEAGIGLIAFAVCALQLVPAIKRQL